MLHYPAGLPTTDRLPPSTLTSSRDPAVLHGVAIELAVSASLLGFQFRTYVVDPSVLADEAAKGIHCYSTRTIEIFWTTYSPGMMQKILSRLFHNYPAFASSSTRPYPRASSTHLSISASPSHPRFCREVVKGKSKEYARSLAKYVRTFRLVNWIDPDTSLSYETAAKFLKECLSAMPYMPNLTTLELSYVAIVPSILRALPNLEQLESLKIIEFALTELHLKPSFDDQVRVLDDYAALAKAFHYSTLTTLVTHLPESVKVIQNSKVPFPLRIIKLKFDRVVVPISTSFFRNLPDLRTFSFGPSNHNGDSLAAVTLSFAHFQRLEEVECDAKHLSKYPASLSRTPLLFALTQHSTPRTSRQYHGRRRGASRSGFHSSGLLRLKTFTTRSRLLCDENKFHPVEDSLDKLHFRALTEFVRALPQVKTVNFIAHQFFPLLDSSPMSFAHQYSVLRKLLSAQHTRIRVVQLGRIVWTRRNDGDWTIIFEDDLIEGLLAQAKGKPLWGTSAADIFGISPPRQPRRGIGKDAPILQNDHRGHLAKLLSPYIIDDPYSGSDMSD
ncbi:hypothetical protein FA13DRAFT_1774568 [Coprinellus micaceus]|uniref:Uncharacterized protein n=1 Tax=Coprinellus micaceus TaxID=71717 RepID=A0A4Y7T9W9_COPMI|nr:hypothetical protein FA13DRAFT_1774568 [Coprinellus micaceus]